MGNAVVEKSKKFAVRIVRLFQYLTDQKKEFVLSKQVLRSGTSIGANIAEAQSSVSKKDFLAKMHIAFKECTETIYWLELLYETDYLQDAEYTSIRDDAIELEKLLTAITKSTKKGIENEK